MIIYAIKYALHMLHKGFISLSRAWLDYYIQYIYSCYHVIHDHCLHKEEEHIHIRIEWIDVCAK